MGAIILIVGSTAYGAGPGWYNNFEQAVQAARQQGRPIFVDFSTSWCSVCKQMDRTTLADPAVVSRLDNFIKVKVDGDAFPQLCQAYGVEAYPTFVHLDPQGRVLEKRVGGMRVQEMAGALDNTLRSVSTSMAIAQANRQAEAQREAAKAQPATASASGKTQIASADLAISGAPSQESRTRTVTREAADQPAENGRNTGGNGSLYNMTNNPLQGNTVYAADQANAGRRSRFGNDTASGDLKQLAEATALPGDAAGTPEAPTQAEEKPKEIAADTEKAPAVSEAATSRKTEPVVTIPQETAKASPVIESRLAAVPTETLPRPLLRRSASGATQTMDPAPGTVRTVSVSNESAPAIQPTRNDNGEPSQALPKETVEIASAAPVKQRVSDNKPAVKVPEPKNSEGATRSDIVRWMEDADSKLLEAHKTDSPQRKREARAMYNKVVEKDPKNEFGKSDMAYVKMVSLIVDKDSDLLRRQAYTKIKDFETRFPDSGHKDYYTLIRAVLATDLGETNEAHKLLSSFTEQFPDSKYGEMAKETLKSLPAVKKESSKSKTTASSSKSGKSSSKTNSKSSSKSSKN